MDTSYAPLPAISFAHLPMDLLSTTVLMLLASVDLAALSCVSSAYGAATVADPQALDKRHDRAERWSIVAEAARRQLLALPAQVRGWVPRRGRESWLRLLHEAELLCLPKMFVSAGPRISLGGEQVHHPLIHGGGEPGNGTGMVATKLAAETVYRARTILACEVAQCAVANPPAARAGVHYAEFTFDPIMPTTVTVGIVPEDFDATCGLPAYANTGGYMFSVSTGFLLHSGSVPRRWAQDIGQQLGPNDTVGLLLDMAVGSLSLFCNSELRGTMVDGGLEGQRWLWAADLVGRGSSVQIEAKPSPLSIDDANPL
jgi:hypothetical protein